MKTTMKTTKVKRFESKKNLCGISESLLDKLLAAEKNREEKSCGRFPGSETSIRPTSTATRFADTRDS
jgi:hypothetical protein